MIDGHRIRLRPSSEADVPALLGLRNDPGIQSLLLARARGSGAEHVREWLRKWSTSTTGVLLVVAGLSDDRAVGWVQLAGLDDVDGRADVGICLALECQGKGFGREAVSLLVSHAAATWPLRKVSLRVRADHARALRCYEVCGFERCGLLRGDVYAGGQWRDVVLMERLLRE
jgi:RimJ/RimL family protein N-acetyltransferase